MQAGDKQFTGAIPDLYDSLFVPMIFAPFAADLAARTAVLTPKRVLETAAGTGAVTRELARRLETAATLTVTDLNQAMLDRAAKTLPDRPGLSLKQADALALPFEDRSFDAVVCQFGIMFFPDRVKGYSEARRVLEPGGRFLFNVWDGLDSNDFARVVSEAMAARYPSNPAAFMARTPHGHGDPERIRAELTAGGFSRIDIEPREDVSRAPSARHAAAAICQATPLRNEILARDANDLEGATKAAEAALTERFGSGEIRGRIRAFVVSAG